MPIFYIEQLNMALSNPQYVYLIEYGWIIIYIHFYISYILNSNWKIFDFFLTTNCFLFLLKIIAKQNNVYKKSMK